MKTHVSKMMLLIILLLSGGFTLPASCNSQFSIPIIKYSFAFKTELSLKEFCDILHSRVTQKHNWEYVSPLIEVKDAYTAIFRIRLKNIHTWICRIRIYEDRNNSECKYLDMTLYQIKYRDHTG